MKEFRRGVACCFIPLFCFNLCFAQDMGTVTGEAKSTPDQANEYGFLALAFPVQDPVTYYVVIDDDYESVQEAEPGARIKIPVGNRKITIISSRFADYTFIQMFSKGVVTTHRMDYKIQPIIIREDPTDARNEKNLSLSSYFWIKTNINVIIKTDPDSDISLDGKSIGRGTTRINLPFGVYELVAKNDRAGTTVHSIRVDSRRLRIVEMYNKPDKSLARFFSLAPGVGQIYKDESIKGYAFLGGAGALFAGALLFHNSFKENKTGYTDAIVEYNFATSNDRALEYGDRAEKYLQSAEDDAVVRDVLLYSGVAVFAWSMLDALFNSPDGGYREAEPVVVLPDMTGAGRGKTIKLGLQIRL